MPDSDIIPHIFDDLREIKSDIKNLCNEVTSLKEHMAGLQATRAANERNEDNRYKGLNIIIPTVVAVMSIVIGKISGLLH